MVFWGWEGGEYCEVGGLKDLQISFATSLAEWRAIFLDVTKGRKVRREDVDVTKDAMAGELIRRLTDERKEAVQVLRRIHLVTPLRYLS